jgi:hypothetical protein
MSQAQANDGIIALREPLRRIDSVLNFARKLVRDSGSVPPGLAVDFHDARKELEKAFVLNFDAVDEKLQKQLREFLQQIKGLTADQIGQHVEKISQRARSALNQLMIHGEGQLTLTDEIGKVRFTDEELLNEPPEQVPSAAYALMTGPAVIEQTPAKSAGTRRLSRTLIAVVLISVLGAVVLAAAILGPWAGNGGAGNGNDSVAANRVPPANRPPSNNPVIDTSKPFNAEAAGYPEKLTAGPLEPTISPLDARPDNLTPGELARLLLGYEELIMVVEPQRLAFKPDETARRLRKFGDSAIAAEPAWREQRKEFLDAFIEHMRKELQLALYPTESEGAKVLVSDVLYSVGGGQLSLVMTLQVLGQSCGAPTRLVSSLGIARPLLAVETAAGIHTYNGEAFGLREGRQPALLLSELMVELSSRLHATMATPQGRVLCCAVIQQHGTLGVELARAALRDISLNWLEIPAEGTEPATHLLHDLAKRLAPAVCEILLTPGAGGNSDEALAVYRLANAAGDADRANRALIVLGERAQAGMLIDGQPLPLVVGDLLAGQGKAKEADAWFVRAMYEQPEDPRPVLRLVHSRTERFDLCREAYLRGERGLGFMRIFAEEAAKKGDDLLSLKLLDEICATDTFSATDLQNAVLTCISLGHADWAIKRLADHAELAAGEPRLQRLELICELSLNGLSERAKQLAKDWRARGEADAFVEGLLKRYGG